MALPEDKAKQAPEQAEQPEQETEATAETTESTEALSVEETLSQAPEQPKQADPAEQPEQEAEATAEATESTEALSVEETLSQAPEQPEQADPAEQPEQPEQEAEATAEATESTEALSVEESLTRQVEILNQQIETLIEQVETLKDRALRAEAEMQNMQRRTAREVENAHRFGLERFIQNLLPVVDSLEKAIESSAPADGDAGDAITEGVRLCHKLLLDVLAKEQVLILDPVGEPFDPNEHQAMSMVENADMAPNSVFAVVQKGYKLHGRLVRPAMVMVTRAPAAPAPEPPDAEPETKESG